MMFRRVLLAFLLAVPSILVAQDIHFSQYFASPVTLNPALTGAFNADFRVAANYRNQGFGVFDGPLATSASGYQTIAASFDMALLRERLNNDNLGVGIQFYNDRAGDGALSTINVMASAAYHKTLDQYNNHSLSIGIQGGIVQKSIDFTKLVFESQFNVDAFDPDIASGETTESSTFYGDFNLGLLWRSRFGSAANAYVGAAYHHLFTPNETFLSDSANSLDGRVTFHGGVDIRLSDYVSLTPGFLVMNQNTATQVNFGAALGYVISESLGSSIYFGAWYRNAKNGDAIIPMLAYEISGVRVGFSFDTTVSSRRNADNSKGAVELSLIYIHNSEPSRTFSPVKFCPRF